MRHSLDSFRALSNLLWSPFAAFIPFLDVALSRVYVHNGMASASADSKMIGVAAKLSEDYNYGCYEHNTLGHRDELK